MREIKFRVWDKGNKVMYQPALKLTNGKSAQRIRYDNGSRPTEPGNWLWLQYTGLKDKNGKEIYEGDIVTSRKMNHDELKGQVYITSERGVVVGSWPIGFMEETEVIGNIYENPELLEAK